jgi:hypothetical protein
MKPFLPIALAAFLLAGCFDEKQWIQKVAPKDDDEFARKFVDLVMSGQYTDADHMVDPAVTAKMGPVPWNQLRQVLNHGKPLNIELIGANIGFLRPWNSSESKREANLTYQIQFRDAWVVAALVVESSSGGKRVTNANLQPVPDSLRVLNRFTLQNKLPIQYAFLAACIGVPLFIVIALVICLFCRVRRRWLWVIFILFGFAQFQLNWTTGQMGFQPISILLLGASFFRASSYAPIVFSFGIPVGATLFLVLRRWLLRKDEPPPLPMTAPP